VNISWGNRTTIGDVAPESEPERPRAPFAVALAPENTTDAGDQADDGVERRRVLGRALFGQDVGGLPFRGREQ
jgi:hypothetical protein